MVNTTQISTRPHYQFKPGWWSTIITMFILAAFITLGFWQIARYHQKINLQQHYATRPSEKPMTLSDINQHEKDLRYYPVTVTGTFDNKINLLLDNKFFKNQVGYEVFTLFIPDGQTQGILVNRGWIPIGRDREHLPNVTPATGHIILQGIINTTEHAVILSNKYKVENPGKWPLRVEAIDIPQLEQLLERRLYPIVLLLKPDQAFGFAREWNPIQTDPQRHLGYALQWFTFAVLLIVIYIYLNLKRKE